MVYQILLRRWAETPHEDARPNIYLLSEPALPTPRAPMSPTG